MTDQEAGGLLLIRRYRQLVEAYEALDTEIDDLIMASRGSTDNMSVTSLKQYRELARQRTDLLNDMRLLEQELDLSAEASAPRLTDNEE